MNLECVDKYLDKLGMSIEKYMEEPASHRSAEAINIMMVCWNNTKELRENIAHDYGFDMESAMTWCDNMKNDDGTQGAHWPMAATEAYRTIDVPNYVWYATMNMMYSDYYNVAKAYNLDKPEFYRDLAIAFLNDTDAPCAKDKIAIYYNRIAKK